MAGKPQQTAATAAATHRPGLHYLPGEAENCEERRRLLKLCDRLAKNDDFKDLRKHEDDLLLLLDVLSRVEPDETVGRWLQGCRQLLGQKQKIFASLPELIASAEEAVKKAHGPQAPRMKRVP